LNRRIGKTGKIEVLFFPFSPAFLFETAPRRIVVAKP
jgi:hypothetical protein